MPNPVILSDTTSQVIPSFPKKPACNGYQSLRSQYLNRFFDNSTKLALFMVLVLSKLATAKAKTCFESQAGNDYSLSCIGGQEEYIFNQLKQYCGVYNDGQNDCADFFINTTNFCSGVFGGAGCTLSYHVTTTPDPCILNATQSLCHNGYGTVQDILSTIGISLGSLLLLCCCMSLCMQIRSKSQTNDNNTPNENQPLINEKSGSRKAGQIAGASIDCGALVLLEIPLHALGHCNVM